MLAILDTNINIESNIAVLQRFVTNIPHGCHVLILII